MRCRAIALSRDFSAVAVNVSGFATKLQACDPLSHLHLVQHTLWSAYDTSETSVESAVLSLSSTSIHKVVTQECSDSTFTKESAACRGE